MTNERIDRTERERRREATADTHGGVEVLDADRPHLPGEPDSTHQTTTDPYSANPRMTRDNVTIDDNVARPQTADGRPLGETASAAPYHTPARDRSSWGPVLTGIAVILLIVLLLVWLL